MTSGQKSVSVFLCLICALLVIILGLCMSWPGWVWLGALGVFATIWIIATLAAIRARRRDPFPSGTLIDAPVPPPADRREVYVSRVPLPSGLADYDFLFSARIRWCPVDPAPNDQLINIGALAVDSVLARARKVTTLLRPLRSSLVQHQLNGVLGVMEEDREGYVRAMALDVELTLTDADQERLDRLASIRKDEAVWEHQRKYEKSKREYLGGDVLTSTGSAVVWWLAKNDDHVEKTVKDIGLLARLSSAANNREVDETFRHLVSEASPPPPAPEHTEPEPGQGAHRFDHHSLDPVDLFADFFRRVGFRPGEAESALIADQVAMAIASRDAVTAAEIHRRFGGRPVPPHTNGAGPTSPERNGDDQPTT